MNVSYKKGHEVSNQIVELIKDNLYDIAADEFTVEESESLSEFKIKCVVYSSILGYIIGYLSSEEGENEREMQKFIMAILKHNVMPSIELKMKWAKHVADRERVREDME